MGKSLASLGCVVTSTANAAEALVAMAGVAEFDLLLSDVRMPGAMDGIQLAEESARRRPQMAVLLQTGFYDESTGRFTTLNKPFSLDELVDAVRSVLPEQRQP
jgi:DNA-binding NtrC family response regulator